MITTIEQTQKHTPGVEISENKIIIKVWYSIVHPMEKAHYISSIDILAYTKAGLIRVKEFNLNPEDTPEISMDLSELKPGVYSVQARCNLHGTWNNEFVI